MTIDSRWVRALTSRTISSPGAFTNVISCCSNHHVSRDQALYDAAVPPEEARGVRNTLRKYVAKMTMPFRTRIKKVLDGRYLRREESQRFVSRAVVEQLIADVDELAENIRGLAADQPQTGSRDTLIGPENPERLSNPFVLRRDPMSTSRSDDASSIDQPLSTFD